MCWHECALHGRAVWSGCLRLVYTIPSRAGSLALQDSFKNAHQKSRKEPPFSHLQSDVETLSTFSWSIVLICKFRSFLHFRKTPCVSISSLSSVSFSCGGLLLGAALPAARSVRVSLNAVPVSSGSLTAPFRLVLVSELGFQQCLCCSVCTFYSFLPERLGPEFPEVVAHPPPWRCGLAKRLCLS